MRQGDYITARAVTPGHLLCYSQTVVGRELRFGGGGGMSSIRGVIVWVLVSVIVFGPLSPSALAQQPGSATPAPPDVARDASRGDDQTRPIDGYDVGGAVATVFKAPGNVATCAFGVALGTFLFLTTLGSSYKATTRVYEEGCAQKWLVRGEDLRPRGGTGILVHPMERYDRERR